MQVFRNSFPALLACAAAVGMSGLSARADVDLDAKAKAVAKSLVIVDFTLRNENSSREDSGQGILLSKEGIVLIAGSLINEGYPKEWISERSKRPAGQISLPFPPPCLGVSAQPPVRLSENREAGRCASLRSGRYGRCQASASSVFGVAILGKSGGYETYIGKSEVRAVVELYHTLGSTASFGLTRGTSPVYDVATGAFVGITVPSMGESMLMQSSRRRQGPAASSWSMRTREQHLFSPSEAE